MSLFQHRPDAVLNYTFEWEDDIPEGISLVAVTYTYGDLSLVSENIDTEAMTSTIMLNGAVHGSLYQVNALAQLSNGEYIPGEATLRAFSS